MRLRRTPVPFILSIAVLLGASTGSVAAPPSPAPAAGPVTCAPPGQPQQAGCKPATINVDCAVPEGFQADPELQKLSAQCQNDKHRIADAKDQLAGSIQIAQGSAAALEQMLSQTAEAIDKTRLEEQATDHRISSLITEQKNTVLQIAETRKELNRRKGAYGQFTREQYKAGDGFLQAFLGSGGISDLLAKMSAAAQVKDYQTNLVMAIKKTEDDLKAQAEKLKKAEEDAKAQKAALIKAEENLIDEEVRQSGILYELHVTVANAQAEILAADSQQADVVARLVAAEITREDELIAQANEAAWASALAWMKANAAAYPEPGEHSKKSPMVWPAQHGVITQPFGPSDLAGEPPMFGAPHWHAGVDVGYDAGSPILAADDGVVAAAEDSTYNGQSVGYGRHVVIAHKNGTLSLYGHLAGYSVKTGEKVKQGQLIGLMGSTGYSTGPHLHFEIRVNNVPVDPMSYLPTPAPSTKQD